MESGASASSSAPKKIKLNFTHVHREFEKIKIFNPRLGKEVDGCKCKVCPQTFMRTNSSTLKTHLKVLHPEIFRAVESKFVSFKFSPVSDHLLIRSG